MLLVLLVAQGVLLLTLVLASAGDAPSFMRAADALVRGDFAPVFWGGALGLGVALPLWVLAFGKGRRLAPAAVAALVLVGTSAARNLLFVVRE